MIDHQSGFATWAHAMQDPKSINIPDSPPTIALAMRQHTARRGARRASANRGDRGTTLPAGIEHRAVQVRS